jgi:plastocyanin
VRRALVVSLLVVVALAGCGGDDDATETGGGGGGGGGTAASNTVTIKDIAFRPDELTVSAGDTVTWVWDDGSIVHDVKFDDFRSKLQSTGRYEHTFDTAGSFDYTCSVHPQMDGTIVVEAAAGS